MKIVAGALLLFAVQAYAAATDEIEDVLQLRKAPPGVVFEIVSSDAAALESAIPKVNRFVRRLRERFPGLAIAVVSHGDEQFALMTRQGEAHEQVHALVRDLSQHQEVPVHVCGTYASWRDVAPEEFPDYVDVVSQGPSQIKDYIDFGYLHIQLDD
jgi:intracellular sulfur oxidation DsrE/DsrF family protein